MQNPNTNTTADHIDGEGYAVVTLQEPGYPLSTYRMCPGGFIDRLEGDDWNNQFAMSWGLLASVQAAAEGIGWVFDPEA